MGFRLHHRQRQREFERAHGGVRFRGDIGGGAKQHAGARVQARVAADGEPGVAGDRRHAEGDNRLEQAVGGRNGGGIQRAGVDGTAGGQRALNVNINLAQLEGEGVECVTGGQEEFVQRQAGKHVDGLSSHEARGGRDGYLGSAVRLVEAHFDFDGVIFVQIVLDNGLIDLRHGGVGHDGIDQDVLALDFAVDGDGAAGEREVEVRRDELIHDQAVAAVRHDVRQQQSADGDGQVGGVVNRGGCIQRVIGKGLGRRARREGGKGDGVLVLERVGEGLHVGAAHHHLLGKGNADALDQVAQEGDLRQRLDGQFGGVASDSAGRGNLVVQLAGQVQPVKSSAAGHVDGHAAERREGGGGIHRDKVVPVAAEELKAAARDVELLGHVLHQRGDHLAAVGQFHAAGGAEGVAARAAADGGVDLRKVDREAVGRAGIAGSHRQVGGVDLLDGDLIFARATVDVDRQTVGDNHAGDGAVERGQEGLHGAGQVRAEFGNFGGVKGGQCLEEGRGVLPHLGGDGHTGGHRGRLLDLDGSLVVPVAQIHLDVLFDVQNRDVHVIRQLGAIVGEAVRVADGDHRTGGKVQARQHHVHAADGDGAVHLRAARRVGGSLARFVQRILRNDLQLDVLGRIRAAED